MVFVFSFASVTGEHFSPFQKQLINEKKLHPIHLTLMQPHGDAIDLAEDVYNNLGRNGLCGLVCRIFQSNEAELIIKKCLVADIFKYTYIQSHLRCLVEKKQGDIHFIPDRFELVRKEILLSGVAGAELPAEISTEKWVMPINSFADFFLRGFLVLIGIIALVVLKTSQKQPIFARGKRSFRYGILIGSEHFFKFKGKRGFDFLLDGQTIHKGNTLFLLPSGLYLQEHIKTRVDRYEEEGYHFFILPAKDSPMTVLKSMIHSAHHFSRLKALRALLAGAPFKTELLHIFIKCCLVAAQLESLLNGIQIERLIYTNQESWRQIACNIKIRAAGGSSWNYSSFLGGGLLYARNYDYMQVRHILWSFLNCDHFLAVNENVVTYYKLHHQNIRRYHVIGSIYAEMINEEIRERDRDVFVAEHFPGMNPEQCRIITFFDTTFIDDDEIVTSYDDAIASYQDILALLEENQDYLLIVKPSKPEKYFVDPHMPLSSPEKGKRLIELWQQFQEHRRVFWAGDAGDVTAITAMSDLVITHCMSTPSLDALGSRKKAIWYESGEKHRGLAYDQIPGLVVHGPVELKQRVRQLLFQTSVADYDLYLEKYVMGTLEAGLDGQGLSRLRQLISQ